MNRKVECNDFTAKILHHIPRLGPQFRESKKRGEKTNNHRYEVDYRQPGTSHVTFSCSNGMMLTVPADKPIKSIYIKII